MIVSNEMRWGWLASRQDKEERVVDGLWIVVAWRGVEEGCAFAS